MRRSDAVMVSSGDEQEMVLPLWLRSIKSAKLHCSCETHPSELRTFHCRVCGVAVCKECKEQHDRFNHEMIKAYKASKGPSFRRDDLKPLWDISGICPYRQDGNPVAYINKRVAGIACSSPQSGFGECVSCQFGLKRQAKYCSVECKVEAVMKMNGSGTQTMTGGSAGYAQSIRKKAEKPAESSILLAEDWKSDTWSGSLAHPSLEPGLVKRDEIYNLRTEIQRNFTY